MNRIFSTFICLLLSVGIFAQMAPQTSQYVLNPLVINPAYAGSRGALNLAAFYRNQWVGIKGAPETMAFSVDAPLSSEKLGLGLIIKNDKIGVTKETQFITNYAFKMSIGEGVLSLGLGAGVTVSNTAWSDLIVLDPGDEVYLVDSKVYFIPNFTFGVYYSYKNYFAGFSMPKLLSYKFSLDKNKYVLKYNPLDYVYLFNTGYAFKLSEKFKFIPSTLLIYSPGEKLQYDLNTCFSFLDRFLLGTSYRNNRSLAGICQIQVNTQLRIAYSYEFDLGKLGSYSNGSHEIMVRYEFRYKTNALNPLNF